MYPSNRVMDYMSEINRLFPRNGENDLYQQVNTSNFSLFSQSTTNRSHSSTDSTSPESFPDTSTHQYLPADRYVSPVQYDSPVTVRRQRPIIGRKLMTNNPVPTSGTRHSEDFDPSVWREDTPQKLNDVFMEQKNYVQKHNVTYELFPAENKGFEFKSPVKTVSNVSILNTSPISNNSSISNISPTANIGQTPPNFYRNSTPFSQPMFGPSYPNFEESKMCTFCRKNGETSLVYMTHYVKEKVGNKNIVTCPILRSHVCSTCGASGDNAHTITYCPTLRNSNNGQPLQSTTITLKNTRVKSNGRRRY